MDTKPVTVKSKRGRPMPNTLNLIEQVRRRVPHHTDYAVAKALEMQQGYLARVMAGKAGLGPKAVVRVSELLQRDIGDILKLVEEDKATTAKDREFWERRSPRITAAVAIAFMALAATLGMGFSKTANAADHCTSVQWSVDRSIHYAKAILRKFLTLILKRGSTFLIRGIANRRLRRKTTALATRHLNEIRTARRSDHQRVTYCDRRTKRSNRRRLRPRYDNRARFP
jgi:hypothetical protein